MQAAGPDPWPGGCGCGSGATMNALAVQDIEAADLLALARLDDGGAPGRCGPPWSQPGRPGPDMIATAQEPMDPRPPPETSGRPRAPAPPPPPPPRPPPPAARPAPPRRRLGASRGRPGPAASAPG